MGTVRPLFLLLPFFSFLSPLSRRSKSAEQNVERSEAKRERGNVYFARCRFSRRPSLPDPFSPDDDQPVTRSSGSYPRSFDCLYELPRANSVGFATWPPLHFRSWRSRTPTFLLDSLDVAVKRWKTRLVVS
ncbi:hypothetical protein EUGRSUZ_J02081 [Eucalyptus grandis]|uniref:Uncharacterized protein n=2 Tax=Eucalyptus grandis TaxID=71139 RepID=A0ACC3J7I9_EUCGR|nr:hypothetical protein EUGRSUZ_J02081 [Eucalyptus grandis]